MAKEAAGDSLTPAGRGEGEALGSQGDELMACESWQRGCRGNADSQGAKYISTPSYKNREHKKDQRKQCYGESHGVAGGEGAGAPAPTAAGSSLSIPYRAWPWAWGKGLPQPQARLQVPRSGRKAGSTGANRLNCPSTSVGTEPRGHGSGCSLIPGGLVWPPGTIHSPEGLSSQHPGQQHREEEDTDSGPLEDKYRGPPRFSNA